MRPDDDGSLILVVDLITLAAMKEVALAMGDEEPMCFACMKPVELGQRIGPAVPGVRSSAAVHAACSGLPLQRQATAEERSKARAVMWGFLKRVASG